MTVETGWSESESQSPRNGETDLIGGNGSQYPVLQDISYQNSSDEELSDRDDLNSSSDEDDEDAKRAVLRNTRPTRSGNVGEGKLTEDKQVILFWFVWTFPFVWRIVSGYVCAILCSF